MCTMAKKCEHHGVHGFEPTRTLIAHYLEIRLAIEEFAISIDSSLDELRFRTPYYPSFAYKMNRTDLDQHQSISHRPSYLHDALWFLPRQQVEKYRLVSSTFNTTICAVPPAKLPRWSKEDLDFYSRVDVRIDSGRFNGCL